MTNDAPHKSKPAPAAKLQQNDASSPQANACPDKAAEAFFALWQRTLRAATQTHDFTSTQDEDQTGRSV